jgi:hypothetical protein
MGICTFKFQRNQILVFVMVLDNYNGEKKHVYLLCQVISATNDLLYSVKNRARNNHDLVFPNLWSLSRSQKSGRNIVGVELYDFIFFEKTQKLAFRCIPSEATPEYNATHYTLHSGEQCHKPWSPRCRPRFGIRLYRVKQAVKVGSRAIEDDSIPPLP